MAFYRSLGKMIPASHLGTWFFIIGYPLFWLELLTHSARHGVTSPLSWVLLGCVALIIVSLRANRSNLFNKITTSPSAPRNDTSIDKLFWTAAGALALVIIALVVMASLKPIHLRQESDCLKYHYTLPRQHLILGSFSHIPWAADDLFLLPIDFSLAPFWFTTVLPNKIPQMIIFFCLIAVCMRLTSALAPGRSWAGPLMALVILGTHGFGIQAGTGMLDLVIAYLFLASLDSLRVGNWFLAGVEFTFFFWSKPLMPIETLLIIGIWGLVFFWALRSRWAITNTFLAQNWLGALALGIVLSLFVAGPFIAKSIDYAGTPLFPLAPGIMGAAQIKSHPQTWQSLEKASQIWMGHGIVHGHGRDFISFIKHWWLLGVPENGVNNAFDYPLGLTYLLMIGPFIFFLAKDFIQRQFHPWSVLACVMWGLWWFSTQESRYLYIPLFIIFIVTIARLEKLSKGLFLCLLVSLSFNAVSLWGAHKNDMAKWGVNDLRPEDKKLVALNNRYLQGSMSCFVVWPSHNVAYAQFPVMVHQEDLPHTIHY